jgi:hypothetical protein
MKLRLHENSIRIRMNRTEVATIAEAGRVEDAVDFGHGSLLAYVVETSAHASAPRASFQGSVIRIELPAQDAVEWARTDRIGISGEQKLDANQRLSILVEKDFQCLHNASETGPDAFPNPLATKG